MKKILSLNRKSFVITIILMLASFTTGMFSQRFITYSLPATPEKEFFLGIGYPSIITNTSEKNKIKFNCSEDFNIKDVPSNYKELTQHFLSKTTDEPETIQQIQLCSLDTGQKIIKTYRTLKQRIHYATDDYTIAGYIEFFLETGSTNFQRLGNIASAGQETCYIYQINRDHSLFIECKNDQRFTNSKSLYRLSLDNQIVHPLVNCNSGIKTSSECTIYPEGLH